MANIRVPPEALRETAASMAGLAEEIGCLLDGLLSKVNGLQDVWEGETQKAYIGEINELVPKVKGDLDRIIVEAPDGLTPKLTRIADYFEELDRSLGAG